MLVFYFDFVNVFCKARCDIKNLYPALFGHVEAIAAKVLLLRWGTVAKHTSVPKFTARHLKQLSLCMDEGHLQAIAAAGDEWLSACSASVLHLAGSGLLGEGMFSCKVHDIVNVKVAECIERQMTELMNNATIAKPEKKVDFDTMQDWQETIVKACIAEVEGVSALPSKRLLFLKPA